MVITKYLKKIKMTFFLLLMGLAGCAIKLPPIAHYTLSAADSTPLNLEGRTDLSLLVNQTTSAPGYDTNRVIYMTRPLQLQSYPLQQWVSPPAQMLSQIMVEAIRQTDYFHAITTSSFSASSDFRLESRLIKLQQVYLANCSQIQLSLWATLIDNSNHKVIATKTFQVVVPANADSYSGVVAANLAAQTLSKRVADFVVTEVKNNVNN